MTRTALCVSLALLALAGCTSWQATRGGERYTHKTNRLTAELPAAWYRYTAAGRTGGLTLTKQGAPLGYIVVDRWRMDKAPLGHTQRRFREGMTPLEAAEIVLDNLRSSPDLPGAAVVATSPVALGGHDGFRVRVVYRPLGGASRTREVWGVLADSAYSEAVYDAPAQVYFDAHYDDFLRVTSSMQVR